MTVRAALRSRPAYAILGVVVVVALVLGSHHGGAPTPAERVAHLESIIKCPSCADLTIAQSTSPEALGLQVQVRRMVGAGDTDAEVEAAVTSEYTTAEILTPHGISGALAIGIPLGTFVVAVVAIGVTLFRRGRASAAGAGAASDGEDLALVSAALAARRELP